MHLENLGEKNASKIHTQWKNKIWLQFHTKTEKNKPNLMFNVDDLSWMQMIIIFCMFIKIMHIDDSAFLLLAFQATFFLFIHLA